MYVVLFLVIGEGGSVEGVSFGPDDDFGGDHTVRNMPCQSLCSYTALMCTVFITEYVLLTYVCFLLYTDLLGPEGHDPCSRRTRDRRSLPL